MRNLIIIQVFTGENATKISIDLLTGVSLGKGGNLAQETGFRDTRHSEIMMLRPLRDVGGKELALYAQYHCLSIFSEPTITTGKVKAMKYDAFYTHRRSQNACIIAQ